MSGEAVELVFDDGETLSLPDEYAGRVYDTLWGLGNDRGAVSTAVVLKDALRLRAVVRRPIMLTASQSAVLRKAVSLLHA